MSLWCETLCPRLIDLSWRDDKTGSGFPRNMWKKLLKVGVALGGDRHWEAVGGEGFRRKAAGADKRGWECFGL